MVATGDVLFDYAGDPVCPDCYDSDDTADNDYGNSEYNVLRWSSQEYDCNQHSSVIDERYENCHIYIPTPKQSSETLYSIELDVDRCGGNKPLRRYGAIELITKSCPYTALSLNNHISNCGLQITSKPGSIKYHVTNNEHGWGELLEYLADFGFCSHDGPSPCGLRFKLSAFSLDPFDYDNPQSSPRTNELIYLFEKFYDKMFLISRRTEKEFNRWCGSVTFGRVNKTKNPILYTRAAVDQFPSEYAMVKIYPNMDGMISVNLFRGTLLYTRFVESLLTLDMFVSFVKEGRMGVDTQWDDIMLYARDVYFSRIPYDYILSRTT